MNFCCGKFEKEHRELSKTSNRMCVVDQERNGKNKRYFFLRIWNERNAYVQIRYCPYCGECLSTFYADDCYINTAMDDVYNIVRATPSAYDSATAKKRESSEAKARRKYGLEVCCGELGYLCDLPLDYDSVKFIITEHILEKSISHHYTIDKGGIERCYLKPISALSFGLLYKRRRQWQESEDEPKDDRKRIDGWNFCPYCGKNLHTFYDNPMYANYIEGKCFDYPEKESSLFYNGGYGANPVYIFITSLIVLFCMILYQKIIVEEAFIAFYRIFPYFFLLFATIFLVRRCILFIKNEWMHVAWKTYWVSSVLWTAMLSFVLSYHAFGVFDILNTCLPARSEPYTVSATIEEIDIDTDDSGGVTGADIVFILDNADNNYARKLGDTEFSRGVGHREVEHYSVGDWYDITFEDGYFGFPKLKGMKKIGRLWRDRR